LQSRRNPTAADAFLKLANVSIFEIRQTEWAKEIPNGSTGGNERYGNTVVGPPNENPPANGNWTWLRIARRVRSRVQPLVTEADQIPVVEDRKSR
jgi:hypothetical protein